jgi:hypothetical protein
MGPVLEKYMAAYLMHGTVNLKKAAAQSLGKFGSPEALGPLWDAFRYFHDYWKGKAAELARTARARAWKWNCATRSRAAGTGWPPTPICGHGIAVRLGALRGGNQQDLRAWQKPLRLELRGQANATVAQYYQFESLADIEEKLGQFRKGRSLS